MLRKMVLPSGLFTREGETSIAAPGNTVRTFIENVRDTEPELAESLWPVDDTPNYVFFCGGHIVGVDRELSDSDVPIHCGRVMYGG